MIRNGGNILINIFALDNNNVLNKNLNFNDIDINNYTWVWFDFAMPTEEEKELLTTHFKFHHLAVEDCLYSLNRPKIDYYEDYNYIVLNSLDGEKISLLEISLFVGDNYIVSYHEKPSPEIDEAIKRVSESPDQWSNGSIFITHKILDNIVDELFPAVFSIEDKLELLNANEDNKTIQSLIDEVYKTRSELIVLRRMINSLRDLLYRILNSDRINNFENHRLYFTDVYNHLLKLSEMVESCRDITSDMRDSYISINSYRMNVNMMLLTVISSIFIPLTFIVGVYGMNFHYMPELTWKYGYFLILFLMLLIGILMFYWFKRKGWFNK